MKSIYSKHDEDGSMSKSSNLVQEEKPHQSDDAEGTRELSPQKLYPEEADSQHSRESPNEESAVVDSQEEKQEVDWKLDSDFKKFMSSPSIESALKLEKKRAEQRLLQLEKESGRNIFQNLFSGLVKNALVKEKERLEKVEATFKALDLSKVCNVNFFQIYALQIV